MRVCIKDNNHLRTDSLNQGGALRHRAGTLSTLSAIYKAEGLAGVQAGLQLAVFREAFKGVFRIGCFRPILNAIHDPADGSPPLCAFFSLPTRRAAPRGGFKRRAPGLPARPRPPSPRARLLRARRVACATSSHQLRLRFRSLFPSVFSIAGLRRNRRGGHYSRPLPGRSRSLTLEACCRPGAQGSGWSPG